MSDASRIAAAWHAADAIPDGAVVGLGTGATAAHAVRRLGERVKSGLRLRGIATSHATEELARSCGVPLIDFATTTDIDHTIDGADEVDPHLQLIKGGGGALLREKVVASRSAMVTIVVDAAKVVSRLGVAFPLPVEVVPFAVPPVARALAELGSVCTVRTAATGAPYRTDNGNAVIDVRFRTGIPDPAAVETLIDAIPGVVESGLFVGLAHVVVIGHADGTVTTRRRPT